MKIRILRSRKMSKKYRFSIFWKNNVFFLGGLLGWDTSFAAWISVVGVLGTPENQSFHDFPPLTCKLAWADFPSRSQPTVGMYSMWQVWPKIRYFRKTSPSVALTGNYTKNERISIANRSFIFWPIRKIRLQKKVGSKLFEIFVEIFRFQIYIPIQKTSHIIWKNPKIKNYFIDEKSWNIFWPPKIFRPRNFYDVNC